ncbi:MAG TPA: hypothetical protein VMV04_04385 [Thermodesulfobacteriota bacterium]|nr:hypothetical protein [Thermodesulfobacteriota bacterium]
MSSVEWFAEPKAWGDQVACRQAGAHPEWRFSPPPYKPGCGAAEGVNGKNLDGQKVFIANS